jgi:hypothetical protein
MVRCYDCDKEVTDFKQDRELIVCVECIRNNYAALKKFEKDIGKSKAKDNLRITNKRAPNNSTLMKPKPPKLTSDVVRRLANQFKVFRFFGCRSCDFLFWRTCFDYKPVAACYKCQTKLNALPKQYEIGKGYFKCSNPTCLNEWTSTPCKWVTSQPCLACNTNILVTPYKISRGNGKSKRMTYRRHKCQHCMNGGRCTFHPNRVYSTVHQEEGDTISDVTSIVAQND